MFVFTSCTNNYIPKARVLAATLKSFHPDWTFCLLLGETPPEDFDLSKESFDRILLFEDLDIPNYPAWLFRHRVVEICTAAKGPALHYFLTVERHKKVMYLDPDIMVCNNLFFLDRMLDEHDLLLTPHQLAPQKTEQSVVDNELCAMQYGVFNLGFVAAARRGDGVRFASWWRERLLRYCYDDVPQGLFTDQRWCDLAPAFFSNLHIVRDPGCNAASWNLTDRTITRDTDGVFWANDKPLRFYHFTGFDSGAGDGMTARYAVNMPAVRELWRIYRERLDGSGHAKLGKRRWAYETFVDGTPITDDMRRLYRERLDLQQAFPDPFARPGFLEWHARENCGPISSMAFRLKRKARTIARRARHVLEQHGGFPQGVPCVVRQSASWVRRWGVAGVARKIWQSDPNVLPDESLPLLRLALQDEKSSVKERLFRLLAPENSPVLLVEHDWGGGADAYCRKRAVSFLTEGRAVARLRYVRSAGRLELAASFGKETLRCEVSDVRELADERFPRFEDIVINELAGWYFQQAALDVICSKVMESIDGLREVLNAHKARSEYLFHDFYAACPRVTLLNKDETYCGLPLDLDCCNRCVPEDGDFSVEAWRKTWKDFLNITDKVVFFSESSKDIVGRVYSLRRDQVVVRPHDIEPLGEKLLIPASGPMRVAVVGNMERHKGSKIVLELAKLLEEKMPEASITVFGALAERRVPKNITVLGCYDRNELRPLLAEHKVTAALFPSIWPETFSFVIHELASLGLPIVAFGLGAQGTFVKSLSNGRIAVETTAEAALAALMELDAVRKSSS